MASRWLFLVCILAYGLFLAKVSSNWMPGIIHVHTTFSDGSDNVPQRVAQAKEQGCRFMIVTDHYEQIGQIKKSGSFAGRDFGFADYFRNCQEQTTVDFATIPGAEIECLWLPEQDARELAHSHLLALCILPEDHPNFKINPEIARLQCAANTQEQMTRKVFELGWIPVAAHPNLLVTKSFPFLWEWQDNRFDFSPAIWSNLLSGLEMFNVETAKQQEDLVEQYVRRGAEGKYLFVTSGCDSHGWHEPKDKERWMRKTWVFARDVSQKSILTAIKEGRTYASQHNAHLENLNYEIGFHTQVVDRPRFRFSLVFAQKTTSPKTIRIYRGGKLCPESVCEFPAGSQRYDYFWEDNLLEGIQPYYIIESPGVLITSPIVLYIKDNEHRLSQVVVGKPSAEQNLVEEPTGPPQYLTKTFKTLDPVWVYLRFVNISKGKHTIRLFWFGPLGTILWKQEKEINVDSWSSWADLVFKRQPPQAGDPQGHYELEIYWDDSLEDITYFERN